LNYALIPASIYQDNRLNPYDLCLITTLYSFATPENKEVNIEKERVIEAAKITEDIYYQSLARLERFGWIKRVRELDQTWITYLLNIPELTQDLYHQPGSKIAQSWSKYFGTRLIKYEELQDLKEFIIKKGMEEELIIKVMEYSGRKASGDPFHYTRAILINLAKEGILKAEEFKEGEYQDGKQIQKNNRGEKKGIRQERPRAELKKDGYK
jgi:hypothetical protein